MGKEFIANYIKKYQESGAEDVWGLNLALRNRGCNVFDNAGLKEIDFPSLKITEKDLESIRIVERSFDIVFFEISGLIYNSENDEILCAKKEMVFRININERMNEDDRTYFLWFKP